MFALDAASGNTLWSYKTPGSVNAGAVVVGGTVFWGSGYAHLPVPGFVGNNQFFAFSVPGDD
jgi:polyvinyl alcohol dehydrogenase (cytochrome)